VTMGPPVGVPLMVANGSWLMARVVRGRALSDVPLWWTLLFALSNYARYAPSHWSKVMDVDKDAQATRLETLMERAVATLPQLVLQSVREAYFRERAPDHDVKPLAAQ
jgi:hypothetical protein